MNSFDIAVSLGLIIAVVTGFRTGLLRSALTILAYLLAMPIALWAMSVISPRLEAASTSPLSQGWPLFFGIFLASGMALGKIARMTLDDAIGNESGIADRLGGAMLGAIRVGLVATSFVLIFDQLLPANRQPAFLKGSQLRPLFSAAARRAFARCRRMSRPPSTA
jgi:membrane protein required for colicin V production